MTAFKKMAPKKLRARQAARKLAKIAIQVLAPMSDGEQEEGISIAEKRIAIFSRGNRRKAQ